ncbi:putative CapK related-protein [Candidatus Zixiibacteriota bacterium]|nr:putative CapK related-protein [candidate division Zixibacteria bacterium]
MKCRGIINRLVMPWYYSRYGGAPNLCPTCHELINHNEWDRSRLEAYQFYALRKILIHAGNHTKYYRGLFDEYGFKPEKMSAPDELSGLPLLTKEIIRARFDDLLADNYDHTMRHISYTGGTTGVKVKICRDNDCRGKRTVFQWRSDNWTGWKLHSRIAVIWPAAQDIIPGASFKQRFADRYISRERVYFAGVLNEKSLADVASDLRKFRPRLIRCFPSPGLEVARYLWERNIGIDSIEAVISTGEPLYPHQRRLLERGFMAPVHNLYASRETGTTAAECRNRHNLHIATDSVYLEIVRDGKTQPPGAEGEIVLTDLCNYGMPLIRYAINDCGMLTGQNCQCGLPFPTLAGVVGRSCDNFIDADGNIVVSASLVLHLIDEGPAVGQVQLIQESRTEILVRISANPHPDQEVLNYYERTLRRIIKGLEVVKFSIVDKIEAEKSGKYRFAICRVGN